MKSSLQEAKTIHVGRAMWAARFALANPCIGFRCLYSADSLAVGAAAAAAIAADSLAAGAAPTAASPAPAPAPAPVPAPAAAGEQQTTSGKLKGLRVAFTTPCNYATRLAEGLKKEGAQPVWCPSIAVERNSAVRQEFERTIWEGNQPADDGKGLDSFNGIAFTSRSGIAAFAEALWGKPAPLSKEGDPFVIGALGKDAELIKELGLFGGNSRTKVVVPAVATPQALIEELGEGHGRRILCPVPLVLGLEEPPVVPSFLEGLRSRGWDAVRLNAYVTRWLGDGCCQPLLSAVAQVNSEGQADGLDALLFTSTAEVEGLLKSLNALRITLDDIRIGGTGKRCLFVAYGPVTAKGASKLGVEVDLVGDNFHSFVGLVDLLVSHFNPNSAE